jgi:hypothetical protein
MPAARKDKPPHAVLGLNGDILSSGTMASTLTGGKLNVALYGRNRVGKCLGKGTEVLMFDGTVKNVEDVVRGDVLMGPDSAPRNVLSTTVGRGQLYLIQPIKGEPWVCNEDHILVLTGNAHVRGRTREVTMKDYIQEMMDDVPHCNSWMLFRVGVEFTCPQMLDIPPYLVGLWMGDGTVSETGITNSKPEIHAYCKQVATEHGLICRFAENGDSARTNSYVIRFVTKIGAGGVIPGGNKFLNFFRNECSVGRSKTIPRRYLTASRQDRMQLLAGILDTDGDKANRSGSYVTVTGELYRNALLHLCGSLGFMSNVVQTKVHVCSSGKISTYYRISVIGDLNEVPTKVKKYPKKTGNVNWRHNVTLFDVNDVGDGDYYGFTLGGDGRFLLGDFTVTHNTTLACQGEGPIALINIDPSLSHVDQPSGARSIKRDDVAVYNIAASFLQGRDGQLEKVKGSEKFVAIVSALRSRFARGEQPFKKVVLDGLTSWDAVILSEVLGETWENMPAILGLQKVSSDQYIERSERMMRYLKPLFTLPCDVWVLAQEKDHNPPMSRTTTRSGKEYARPAQSKLMSDSHPAAQEGSFFSLAVGDTVTVFVQNACNFVMQLYEDNEWREEKLPDVNMNGTIVSGQVQMIPTGRRVKRLRCTYHPNYAAGFQSPVYRNVPEWIEAPTPEERYAAFMDVVMGKRTKWGKYQS